MKNLLVVLMCILLVACGGTRIQQQIVYKKESVVVEPNSDMLRECSVTEAVNKEEYLNADEDKKEDMLTDLIINLYNDLKNCNTQIQELVKWFEKQRNLYNKKE